jgi:Domain of unknown function (DUF4406)
MMTETAYISGKITGLADLNVPKFKAAESLLRTCYGTVINPHVLCKSLGVNTPWHIYMRRCIGALPDADVVFLLDDWKQSRGAMVEVIVAIFLKIPVVAIETMDEVPTRLLKIAIFKYFLKNPLKW